MLKLLVLSFYALLLPPALTRDYSIRDLGDAGTTEYDIRDLCEHSRNIEEIPSADYWPTEPRREINKLVSLDAALVTDRITVDYGIHTVGLCRCWKSKDFPFCDGSHKLHNKFHKDNVGPVIIDGPTVPDYIADIYTRPTPNRSITVPTEPTDTDSEIRARLSIERKKFEYPDSDENKTDRIDKNDFFERMKRFPPGLRPAIAPWGFV